MKTLDLIKVVFWDIVKLYKNIFHWGVSKIIIFIYVFLLSILLTFPLFIIIIILFYVFWIWEYINSMQLNITSLSSFFLEKTVLFFLMIFLLIFTFLVFSFWYSYKIILFNKLNFSYLKNKKLQYFKNSFFDFKLIWKYFLVSSWNALVLLIPIIIFIIWFILIVKFNWWFEYINNILSLENSESKDINKIIFTISIFSLILFVICAILFFYLIYRIIFSYIILVDEENYPERKKSLFYVKESLNNTRSIKSFFKYVLLTFIIILILLPFNIFFSYISSKVDDLSTYINYIKLSEQEQKILEKNTTSSYLISQLKMQYSTYDEGKLYNNLYVFYTISLFLSVINFVFILWVLEMFTVSFYKNEIIKR